METFDEKYTAKDLVSIVNDWNPGAKATASFLNECSLDDAYMTQRPEDGQGKWRKYNERHLFEFGLLCICKSMRITRNPAKELINTIRLDTGYHKAKTLNDMKKCLRNYYIVIKNHGHLQIADNLNRVMEILKGSGGPFKNAEKQRVWGPATHAIFIAIPEILVWLGL